MKKYVSVLATVMLSAACVSAYSDKAHSESTGEPKGAGESAHGLQTLDDRFSYAYGVQLGENFKKADINLNIDVLASALRDAIAGEAKMSPDEVMATVSEHQAAREKKEAAERAIASKKNKKEGAAFLAKNAKKDGVIVTESGLQYKVIHRGDGDYKPTPEDIVNVHYRATLIDGTKFDSTYDRNELFSSKVRKLIPGWAEAIQLMSEGDKFEIYIPADLAYGEEGSGDYVEPQAVLIFEVELIEIEKMS
ncbi:FKBP-type peptidyl-prolyl cis-trans isomerase N-terminal domain-containing protein [Aurantivibrio plasticivorans]